MSSDVLHGIYAGLILAFLQASAAVASLKWSWDKKFFYTVWGIGTLIRFVFFGLTAFVVYKFTNLNLAATLISLSVATMIFLIFEVRFFLTPKK